METRTIVIIIGVVFASALLLLLIVWRSRRPEEEEVEKKIKLTLNSVNTIAVGVVATIYFNTQSEMKDTYIMDAKRVKKIRPDTYDVRYAYSYVSAPDKRAGIDSRRFRIAIEDDRVVIVNMGPKGSGKSLPVTQ